jgi:hypothetical protein
MILEAKDGQYRVISSRILVGRQALGKETSLALGEDELRTERSQNFTSNYLSESSGRVKHNERQRTLSANKIN